MCSYQSGYSSPPTLVETEKARYVSKPQEISIFYPHVQLKLGCCELTPSSLIAGNDAASKNSLSPARKSGKVRLSACARPRDASPMLRAPALELVTPTKSSDALPFDTIVAGDGPAGASCALWLKMLGYRPCIIEKSAALGGLQAESPYANSWVATAMDKKSAELAQEIHRNVFSNEIDCFFGQCVQHDGGTRVEADSGMFVQTRTVVLATGVRSATGGLSASENIIIGPGKRLAS